MFDLRPYQRAPTKLADLLPWAALIAPGVILNKDGSLQRTMGFRGPDLDSATDAELVGQASRLNNALRRFGSGWCLHLEARRAPSPAYPKTSWTNVLAGLIDEERRALFEAADTRFESAYFLTLTWLAPPERQRKLENLVFEGGGDQGDETDYRAQLARFLRESDQILALFETMGPHARWLSDEESLGYLHDCISDRRLGVVAVPNPPIFLDALLPDAPLVGGLAPSLGAKRLTIVSLRAYAASTSPGLFDRLNRLAISCRWVTRFIPLDREAARGEIEKIRKRWFSKRKGLLTLLREALLREEAALLDNDATNQALDADEALQDLGADAVIAGFATITITIAEADDERGAEALRLVRQLLDELGFVSQVESVNAVEAWLGSLPGQAYADVRRPLILSPSLAHLAPTSAVWAGPLNNAHLKGPPLSLAAAEGATPFRLNLHVGDVGHTLVVGPTGAGKSVLLGLLAAQWLRYPDAQVFIFDKGRSSRALVLGLAGVFYDLGAAQNTADGFSLQPLAHIDAEEERAWALDWLVGLLRQEGVSPTPELKAEVWSALSVLAKRPAEERTLSVLAALIQDRATRLALEPFTHAGAHGRLLDADHASFDEAIVQAFEMDEVLANAQAAAPVLTAIFHALERRFDGRATLLVLDEAWLFLRDPLFAAQIQDWLKTLRKKNVAVIFASQEIADIDRSPIAQTIIEACATRIFLPNDRAREPRTRAFYEGLGLNPRQVDLITTARGKRDYYLTSREGQRLFELELGPIALAFLAASSPDNQLMIDEIASAAPNSFAPAWLRARGFNEAALKIETGTKQARPAPALVAPLLEQTP